MPIPFGTNLTSRGLLVFMVNNMFSFFSPRTFLIFMENPLFELGTCWCLHLSWNFFVLSSSGGGSHGSTKRLVGPRIITPCFPECHFGKNPPQNPKIINAESLRLNHLQLPVAENIPNDFITVCQDFVAFCWKERALWAPPGVGPSRGGGSQLVEGEIKAYFCEIFWNLFGTGGL